MRLCFNCTLKCNLCMCVCSCHVYNVYTVYIYICIYMYVCMYVYIVYQYHTLFYKLCNMRLGIELYKYTSI